MFFDYNKHQSAWTLDVQCASEMVEIVAAKGKTPRIAIVYKGAEPVIEAYQHTITFREPPESLSAVSPASQQLPAEDFATEAEQLETAIMQGMYRPKRHLRIAVSGPVNLRVRDTSLDAHVGLGEVSVLQPFVLHEGRRVYTGVRREIQLFDARELTFDIAGDSELNLSYATDCRVQGTLHDQAKAFFTGNFLRGIDVDEQDPGTLYQVRGKFLTDTQGKLFSSKDGLLVK